MRVFCSFVAGGADPGRGSERFSERFFWDSNQWIRIQVLKDVGWRPSVKTGASVPSYSGGVAVGWWIRMRVFCFSVAGGADPGRGSERFSERFFWDSNQWI
jgi:hypothetical protein